MFGKLLPLLKPKSRELGPESRAKVDALVATVRGMARPCLQLKPAEQSRSWLGGAPSMPTDRVWPRRGQVPLSFLAQLDLAEIRRAGGPEWLPNTGGLLFFLDTEYGTSWSGSAESAEGLVVMHVPEQGTPQSTPFPPDLPKERRYRSYPVRYETAASLPSYERYYDAWRALSEQEHEEFEIALNERPQSYPNHQIDGYPDHIQDDAMEGSWDALNEEATAGPEDWRLLFQLDSDDAMGTNWVDGGRIYFWILPKDAAAGDFTNTWATIQFH